MAKYHDFGNGEVSFTADVDLTTKQYFFVTLASTVGNVKVATGGSHPVPIGILQNSPSAGEAALVRFAGFSKLLAEAKWEGTACNIGYGKIIVAASDGRGAGVASDMGLGNARWMSASFTSGCLYGEVLLFGMGFAACAAS